MLLKAFKNHTEQNGPDHNILRILSSLFRKFVV